MGASKLEHVHAKGNPVSSDEVEKYIDALHINASVIKLDLSLNTKIEKGLEIRLKNELGHNKAIRKEIVPFYQPERDPAFINLTNRMISNLIPFEKFMLSWSIVNIVDLSWNRINDDGLSQLIDFFSMKVSYLKQLNISSNLFGKESAKRLPQLFHENCVLEKLNVSQNNLNHDVFLDVIKAMSLNQTIHEVNFSSCHIALEDTNRND